MHKYDYSFLKDNIPASIVSLAAVIADLKSKGEFRKLQYGETYEKLSQKAVVDSVKGSNAIEGIITSDERIKKIVSGAVPVTHDEMEIAGYRDVLNLIHSGHDSMDIDEHLILSFHEIMEQQNDPEEAGHYKKTDNLIVEISADGTRRVRFRPVLAARVPKDMEQLLLAYYDARQDDRISPLLLVPCFILDFLCIHPFTDGNGRVSRLLTVLLLYMSGYDIVKYISFEGQINRYKDSYYDALRESSGSWHENENDYVPFIINFLQTLYRCYKDLDDAFMEISLKKAKKSERIKNVLLSAVVPVSKQDILDKVPDVSVKTVELVLNRMLKEGTIRKIGTFKDARYFRNSQI